MTTHPMPTFPAEDLTGAVLERREEIFAAAERKPVTLARSEGDDLVLLSAGEFSAQQQAMALVSELASVLVGPTSQDYGPRLVRRWPWLADLPPRSMDAFMSDVVTQMRAAVEADDMRELTLWFVSWRETARAHADGLAPSR